MSSMDSIIGSNPLTQLMQQKGIPLSALSQMSPAASNFQPDMQVPPNPPMPSGSPMSVMGPMGGTQPPPMPPQATVGQPAPPQPQMPMGGGSKPVKEKTEEEAIVKALVTRLQALTKLKGGGMV